MVILLITKCNQKQEENFAQSENLNEENFS